ncbi:MAG: hypothetical protein U1F43_30945 [Myxococcota bacterium]
MRATALATALALATLASAGCPSAPAPRPPGGDGEAQRHGAKKPRPTPVEAAFTVSFEADPDEDPIGLEGATDLLVELLATEGQERAAAYGATLEAFREAGRAGWRIRGPDAAFEQMAAIVLDLALDPRLSGTELATRTERWRERLRVRPDAVVEAARRWAAALATGHGRPVGLEPSDNALATVNREDLVRLHRRLVRPARRTISASHPLGPELTQRLADAAPSARPSAPGDAPALPRADRVVLPAGRPERAVVATVAPAPEREAWAPRWPCSSAEPAGRGARRAARGSAPTWWWS